VGVGGAPADVKDAMSPPSHHLTSISIYLTTAADSWLCNTEQVFLPEKVMVRGWL
jgi:hypothetical protein